MDIITIKILGGISLWLSMIIFGLLPLYNQRLKTSPLLISLSNCFCGGLFISIGLIHILPESHEMLDEVSKSTKVSQKGKLLGDSDEGGIQYSYLVCLMSYSFILFLDKVVFNNSDLIEENPHNEERSQKLDFNRSMIKMSFNGSMAIGGNQIENNFKERISSKYKLALRISRNSNLKESIPSRKLSDLHEHDKFLKKPKLRIVKNHPLNSIDKSDESNTLLGEKLISNPQSSFDSNKISISSTLQNEKSLEKIDEENYHLTVNKIKEDKHGISEKHKHKHEHEHDNHNHNHNHNLIKKNDSIITSIVLLIAMGIHGFFAMLAFGIEPSKSGTVNLFIALIAHKWSEALTVGKNFSGK